jgi:hypothetical protein
MTRRRRGFRPWLEGLEARWAPHGGHGGSLLPVFSPPLDSSGSSPNPTTAPTQPAANAVPILESNPGAGTRLYLDFNGHFEASWGDFHDISIPAYDTDGNPSTFSQAEQENITTIWRYVGEDFAPFNINVTTVEPASFDASADLRVAIGGDGAWTGSVEGGIAYTGLFSNPAIPNVVFVFPDALGGGNPRFVAESISHESGHAFGLDHQSLYDDAGNLLEEYNPGNADHAPIMGDPYNSRRGVWWHGPTDESPNDMQDDMAVIAAAVGWRADDVGDGPFQGTPLTVNNTFVGGAGIIGKMSDVDAWEFSTDDGAVMFQVSVPAGINNLDAKVQLVDADGNVVVPWQDPEGSYNALLVTTVTSGTYWLMVGSHGAYGDVGQYLISGVVVPPGSVLPAPTDLSAAAIGPDKIQLSWSDNASDETGYQIERSTDGVDWLAVAQVDADINSYIDVGLQPATIYNYRVAAVQGIYLSEYSNEAGAMTWPAIPAAPTDLTATAIASDQVHLTWSDNANNETAYVLEHSVDGLLWPTIAVLPTDSTSYTDYGLIAATAYLYRVRALNGLTPSADSNLASTATPAPAPDAPSGLTAIAVGSHQINLSWNDNSAAETGYAVESSLNGTSWTTIAQLPSGSASYASIGLQAATAYYFRVRALNGAVSSGASNVAVALTSPNPPLAPSGLKAFSLARNAFLLSWNDSSGSAAGYKIVRTTNGVNWTTVGYTGPQARVFKIPRPNRGRNYYYAVVGINAGGESSPSNLLAVKYASVFRAVNLRLLTGQA